MKKIFVKFMVLIAVCVFLAQAGYAANNYKVELISFNDKKIGTIKAVRKVTGMSLMDSKRMVDRVPITVKSDLSMSEAEVLLATLEKAGAEARIETAY